MPALDPQPTRLPPQYFAFLYGLMIVYASLEPFSGWMAPIPGTPFFLFAPIPTRFTRFDVAINVIAYIPFGFFVALTGIHRAARPWWRFAAAACAGALLSVAMESTQMLLPTRDASIIDFAFNTAGAALGGLVALVFNRLPGLRPAIARLRHRVFIGGKTGDLGLALLGVWLLAQVNPGIPLFAATFDPSLELTRDLAGHAAASRAERIQRDRRGAVSGPAGAPSPLPRPRRACADRCRSRIERHCRSHPHQAIGIRGLAEARESPSAS